jgi:hypothetical protein
MHPPLLCIDVAKAACLDPGIRKGKETAFKCPAHNDNDPSLEINEAKNMWICRVCGTGGNAWELAALLAGTKPNDKSGTTTWLQNHGFLNGNNRHNTQNTPYFQRLWSETVPMTGPTATPGRRYLENRGLVLSEYPVDMRFHPAMAYFNEQKQISEHPGLVFLLRDRNGNPIGAQRIYLTQDGKKADVPEPKKSIGPISSGGIFLGEFGDSLNIAEGPETALAVWLATGMPTVCTVSASGMSKFDIPDTVRTIDIWADLDRSEAGQLAAKTLATRAHEAGKTVYLRLPSGPVAEGQKSRDWLDVLCADGADTFQYELERGEPWAPPKAEEKPSIIHWPGGFVTAAGKYGSSRI